MLTRRKTAGALSAIETGFPPIALQSHKELDVRNVVPGSEHKPGLGILLTPYFKLGKELFFNGHRPLLRVLRTPVRSFSSRHLHGLELDLSRLVHPVEIRPFQYGHFLIPEAELPKALPNESMALRRYSNELLDFLIRVGLDNFLRLELHLCVFNRVDEFLEIEP